MDMRINYCKRNNSLSAESLVLGKLARHLCLRSTFLVYTYFVLARHFSNAGPEVHNEGGVKCQPFLKRCNYRQ